MPTDLPTELGEAREIGEKRFRNIAYPVAVFELTRTGALAQTSVVDPVCRMQIEIARAVASIAHAGITYHFCSLKCAGAFANAPELYVATEGDLVQRRTL